MSNSMPEAPNFTNLEFQTSQTFAIFAEHSELEALQLSLTEIDAQDLYDMNEDEVEQISKKYLASEGYITMKNAKNAYLRGNIIMRKKGSALKFCNYDVQ